MATILKRTVKGITYFYLEQTVRDGTRVARRSRYLGRKIPKEIESIKRQFEFEIKKERWFDEFEKIKKNYAAEERALPNAAREKRLQDFSVRFTYDTQRIEGSRLTLRETAQLLEEGVSPRERPIKDVKEAEAHQRVFFEMLESKKDLSRSLVLDWHWKLFRDTKPEIAGKIRRHGVRITG